MFRVVILGYGGAALVDQLRSIYNYGDIKFAYCDTDEERLKYVGQEDDEHILLRNFAQCRDAIHDDNELMAVLVTDLYEVCAQKFAVEIMTELWGYADHTYCFANIPFAAGGRRPKALEVFRYLTEWSDLTVMQDNSNYNAELIMCHPIMETAMMPFLDMVLRYPDTLTGELESLPLGVELGSDQILKDFITLYSESPEMKNYKKFNLFSFHPSTHEY